MKVTRILVIEEEGGDAREIRLVVHGRPVEFEFRPPSKISVETKGLSEYGAIAVSRDCARQDFLELFLRETREKEPPVFLFGEEPPLREIARWILWSDAAEEGAPSTEGRLLSESLEYYSLASLYQQCLKIMTSQDEDKVLAQITDTLVRELGAESCVIWLASPSDADEMMIASVRGVISIDREGSRFFLSQTEWADTILKGEPFLAASTQKASAANKDGVSALYIPLVSQEKLIGLIKLGERSDRKPYDERDRYLARIIGDYAAFSLRTVDRLMRVEKISLRDPETSAYSAAFLTDYFEKERYKSGRFRRPLSLVFLVIENFTYLTGKTRESLVMGALSGIVDAIRKALRDSDLIARVDPDRFCIILPETDYYGSMLAVRRLRKAIRELTAIRYLGSEYLLQPFFMSATYPRDGKEFAELSGVAEEKYQRQQKSPLHKLRLMEKNFWDAFDVLVGKSGYYDLLKKGEEVPYFARMRRDLGRNDHFSIDREMFFRVVESVAQDVAAKDNVRGLVIAAGPRPEIFKQVFLSFGSDIPLQRNIYIIGQTGATRFDAKNMLYVNAEDDHLKDREVLLYLKESSAFGVFATGQQEDVCGFNTADEWLVEAMMEKMQVMYQLQGNF